MTGVRLDYPFPFLWTLASTQRDGAKIQVYESETTTPVSLFSDRDCLVSAANPIVSAAGIFPVRYIATSQLLTMVLKDGDDAEIASEDEIEPYGGSASGGDTISGVAPALTFEETDQVSPAGRWRWIATGGVYRLERNTAVAGDFSSFAVVATFDASDGLTVTDLTVSDDLVVTDDASIGGDLAVTGAATITGEFVAPVADETGVSGELTTAHRNRHLELSGGVTMPANVMSARDKNTFDPGTSNRTFTRGSGLTMYVNGVDVASATLAANMLGSGHWRSPTVLVLSGAFS